MRTGTFTNRRQQGVALVLTMLLLVLFGIFSLGLYVQLTSETRASSNEYFSSQAFYAAAAGIEKMTNDLSKIYVNKTQPDPADFAAIMSDPPRIDGYNLSEYRIDFNGASTVRNIPSGPYEGLVALVQPYKLFVTATGVNTQSQVRRRRDFLNSMIPLFQFGIFYDGDLEAHAGPNFNFGGRVHTNGDLYVTAGSQTIFNSRITVAGEVVRDVRKNGDSAGPSGNPPFNGTVYVLDVSGQPQPLLLSGTGEGGSVIGGPNRPLTPPGRPNPVWPTYSPTKFGGNLLNGQTGARALRLPLQVAGNQTIELIKRGTLIDPPVLKQARYFYKPGLRITLSNVPDPVLGGGGCILTADLTVLNRCVPRTAVKSPAPGLRAGNTHFKVEIVSSLGSTTDVTQEFLDLGITDDPSEPNAIIHLQRHNVYEPADTTGIYPITFYDMREGEIEDTVDTMAGLAGVMTAMEIDIANLGRWLAGAIGTSGATVPNNNGYVIYTSDRRGEINVNGEFDYEDTIFRNDKLDPGEDLNGNGLYDQAEKPAPLDVATNVINGTPPRNAFVRDYLLKEATTFRRCLRLVNGATLAAPITVASENPIYIKGDYNSINKKPASIVGDGITILSNNWNDQSSYNEGIGSRPATPTTVQAAMIAGNTFSVYADPRPAYNEPHSSGGVHNLIRFLENWSGVTFTYLGSLVNLYNSRQAIGQWKCCVTVYTPPIRNWSFDADFLNPAKLPPATPNVTVVEIQRVRQDLYQPLN